MTYTYVQNLDSKSGCNGFTFPFTISSPGSLAAVDRQKAGGWWWRDKNWGLSSSWSIQDSDGNLYSLTNGPMTLISGQTNELDLASLGPQFVATGTGAVLTFSPITTSSGGGGSIIYDSGLLYPAPQFFGGFTIPSGPDAGKGTTISFDNPGSPTGTFTLDIDGISYTVFYNNTSPAPPTVTPGSMTLTPIDFWAWSP